ADSRLSGIDDLEDHLDDLLDGGEMEMRIMNTIQAARLVAPAAWKASQDTCAEYLGKLYCNCMTVGRAGVSGPLARRRYWSGIRGGLYADFGVGLFPVGAMFNHSCQPNCVWRTDALGNLRVSAVEDVPAGSQLFISYVDILQPLPVRQDLLRQHFFFECACPRCRPRPRPRTNPHPHSHPHPHPRSSQRRRTPVHREYPAEPFRANGNGTGTGIGNEQEQEELVAAGWVCPKRQCCRRGRVVRPRLCRNSLGREGDIGGGGGGGSSEDGWGDGGRVRRMLGGRCNECRGVTEEGYFDRWTEALRTRQAAADDDFAQGRSARGRRRLADLQV
ncbi:unnamed protein product, partial [Laminaria digitata]